MKGTRELKTADEIREEVSRLIHDDSEAQADQAKIIVPVPIFAGPDSEDCNWIMFTFRGDAVGHQNAIRAAVADVKRRWNLREQ